MNNTKHRTATLTWFNGNYGSIVQAYALQHTLFGLGFENEIINYLPDKKEKLRFFISSSARNVTLKNKLDTRKINSHFMTPQEVEIKSKQFQDFERKHLNLTRVYRSQNELIDISDAYDVYICGSDQVWNPQYFKGCNFLDFVADNKKKVAFAPSVGTSVLSESEKSKIQPLLRRFNYISVREEQGAELIQPLVEVPVAVVCDPVFLVPKDEWIESLHLENCGKDGYIFCYFLGENEAYLKAANKMAEITGLKIKSVPNNYWGYNNDIGNVKTAGPYEWLNLLYNADIVLTDSFHATAFSLIFNKSFYTLKRFKDGERSSQNSRIYNILNIVNLSDRIYKAEETIERTNVYISLHNWEKVNEALSLYRSKSMNWLTGALMGDNQ